MKEVWKIVQALILGNTPIKPFDFEINLDLKIRGSSSRPGGWRDRRAFYIPIFDAINQQNEQPTTVNIFFNSPKPFQLSNVKISTTKIRAKI